MAPFRTLCGAAASVAIVAMSSAAVISAASQVQAQQYPDRLVTIISDSAAGSRRHRLWDGQVPRLAGQGEENHPAHSGLGEERSARRHLLTLGLPLG